MCLYNVEKKEEEEQEEQDWKMGKREVPSSSLKSAYVMKGEARADECLILFDQTRGDLTAV